MVQTKVTNEIINETTSEQDNNPNEGRNSWTWTQTNLLKQKHNDTEKRAHILHNIYALIILHLALPNTEIMSSVFLILQIFNYALSGMIEQWNEGQFSYIHLQILSKCSRLIEKNQHCPHWLQLGWCLCDVQLCSERLLTVEESVECVVLRRWLMQVPADMAGTQPDMDHKNKMREKAVREKEKQKVRRLDWQCIEIMSERGRRCTCNCTCFFGRTRQTERNVLAVWLKINCYPGSESGLKYSFHCRLILAQVNLIGIYFKTSVCYLLIIFFILSL